MSSPSVAPTSTVSRHWASAASADGATRGEGVEGRAHYDLATQVWEAHRAVEIADEALRSARRGPLECWDMRPSDAWGVLGREEADTW
eukprot:2067984-Rhodomonas_salina.1